LTFLVQSAFYQGNGFLQFAADSALCPGFEKLVEGDQVGGVEGDFGGHFHVGNDTFAIPVGVRCRVDGFAGGDKHPEVVVQAKAPSGVGPAASGFADDGGPLKGLQIVGEFFGGGEGFGAGEHEYGFVEVAGAGNVGHRPPLMGFLGIAPVQVVEVDSGMGRKQVAAQQGHHSRRAPLVVAQVEDQGIGMGNQGHGRRHSIASKFRRFKPKKLNVANIAGEPFDFVEVVVAAGG
jgi:hypothetical protein